MKKSARRKTGSDMERREFLARMGAYAAAASSLGVVSGLLSSASGQVKVPTGTITTLPTGIDPRRAQILTKSHYLAQAQISQAARFPMGSGFIDLGLLTDQFVGIVGEYPLSDSQARTLGVKTEVVEICIGALATGTAGMKAIQSAFARYRTPTTISSSAHFCAMTVRRRVTTATDRLSLAKQFPVAESMTMIIGLFADKTGMTAYLMPPTYTSRKSKLRVRPPILTIKKIGAAAEGGATEPPPAEVAPPLPPPAPIPEEADFTQCFAACAAGFFVLMIGTSLLTGLGGTCVAAIGALAPSAGLSGILAIPSCIASIALLLAPIVICAGACGVDLAT